MSILNVLKFITTHPLNRQRPLAAVGRFVKWQIASRLAPGDIVHPWVGDSKFLVRNGETGLTGNIYTGLHEFPDMAYLLHALRQDDLFVDVGANVGSYTILACAVVGASGIAFEPVPATHRRLTENIRLNHLERSVRCLNIGLGRRPETIRFTSEMDTVNHVLAEGEAHAGSIEVEVSTLDMVLAQASPNFMKIDVEGYETPVLDGALETLAKPTLHSVIIELNGSGERYGHDESLILRKMLDNGFKTYSYDPFARRLINLGGKNLASGNTLFIRDEKMVAKRLQSAPKFAVNGTWL